ncbi:MAG: hypothetical protein VX874_11815 [Pseudomonadota bacterium]|nr:hypothetical protein [Pseudomonadota bacterium]
MVNAKTAILSFCMATLGVTGANAENCNRESFGSWSQKNLLDTRNFVLARDALGEIDWFEYSSGKYRVVRSTWRDALTGKIHYHQVAEQLDVDHIIPVCFAYQRGADLWDESKRKAFYNDSRFLIVTHESVNAAKGVLAPWDFVPINRTAACSYVTRFREGVVEYEIELSQSEWKLLDDHLNDACVTKPAEHPS